MWPPGLTAWIPKAAYVENCWAFVALQGVGRAPSARPSTTHHAIAELICVIIAAPADKRTRAAWLDWLFEAHAADQNPYIEHLADRRSELCVTREVASAWATS